MAEHEQDLNKVGEAIGYVHKNFKVDVVLQNHRLPERILLLLENTLELHSCIGKEKRNSRLKLKFSPKSRREALIGCQCCSLNAVDPNTGLIYCPIYRKYF
jgi:hypothetical protein